MAVEIVRKLVGGVWKTVRSDETAGGGLPAGGSTGEVLTKESNADGDAGWEAPGGSQPPITYDYTDVASPTAAIALNTDDRADETQYPIRIKNGADEHFRIQTEAETDAEIETDVYIQSKLGGSASLQIRDVSESGTTLTLRGNRGSISATPKAGNNPYSAAAVGGGAQTFAVLDSGAILTAAHAAPGDGDLAAGEVALWFDQTNGAAKLKIKGKSANGTVVTGEVALA